MVKFNTLTLDFITDTWVVVVVAIIITKEMVYMGPTAMGWDTLGTTNRSRLEGSPILHIININTIIITIPSTVGFPGEISPETLPALILMCLLYRALADSLELEYDLTIM